MAVEIKRVAYTYNSLLEDQGQPAYFLDVIVSSDANTLVDVHQSFKSLKEFNEAIEEIVPVLQTEGDTYG